MNLEIKALAEATMGPSCPCACISRLEWGAIYGLTAVRRALDAMLNPAERSLAVVGGMRCYPTDLRRKERDQYRCDLSV